MTEILGQACGLPLMLLASALLVKPLRTMRDALLKWEDNREKGA